MRIRHTGVVSVFNTLRCRQTESIRCVINNGAWWVRCLASSRFINCCRLFYLMFFLQAMLVRVRMFVHLCRRQSDSNPINNHISQFWKLTHRQVEIGINQIWTRKKSAENLRLSNGWRMSLEMEMVKWGRLIFSPFLLLISSPLHFLAKTFFGSRAVERIHTCSLLTSVLISLK